jgi:long-chain-fatty-acid--CoA ligase ACSBG
MEPMLAVNADDEGMSTITKLAVAGGLLLGAAVAKNALTAKPAKVDKLPPTFNQGEDEYSPYDENDHTTSSSVETVAKIRYAKRGLASQKECPARTIPELFNLSCKKNGNVPALRAEVGLAPYTKGMVVPPSQALDQWKTWTWSEYQAAVRTAAKAFIELGLARFDAVTIWGFNSPEWMFSELATIFAGGCAAGIYPTDTPQQVTFKARHSGAVIAVVEDMKKAKALIANQKDTPKLKAVVVWAPDTDFATYTDGNLQVLTWNGLMKLGEGAKAEKTLDARIAAQKPGNVCSFIYTSGTTGNPKAVMITHDNIIFESFGASMCFPDIGEERVISYLPLSHVAGMMVDIICPIVLGVLGGNSTVYFARAYDIKASTIVERIKAVRPTMFLGVPRVWEKIAEKMKQAIAAAPPTGIKLKIGKWGKGLGLEHQRNCQLGGTGEKGFGYGFAKKKVLDLVRSRLGLDACKFGFTGAAPISIETLEFFGAYGIQINEVYGMSECCGAVTFSTDEAHVWGSCGFEMPGMELKILDAKGQECPPASDLAHPEEWQQGEICYRGRNIMLGYMANPDLGKDHVAEITKKTQDAILPGGWLHSGDKGCKDERGMVKITGRYKELIIGAGGENIAPVPLEDHVKKLHPGISNIIMIGDQRKFNVALVTLKAEGATGDTPGTDVLAIGAKDLVPGVTKISEAAKNADYIETIKNAIVQTNKDVAPSRAAWIQKFAILPHDFSVQGEELTPTFKLKRSVVAKKYANTVDAMYDPKNEKSAFIPFAG